MDWLGVTGMVVTMLGGLGVGAFTRRSAKEQNAGQLYSGLTTVQTNELVRQADRITALEEDREASKRLARDHERWDRALTRRLREVLPDEEFPDPPPLDS